MLKVVSILSVMDSENLMQWELHNNFRDSEDNRMLIHSYIEANAISFKESRNILGPSIAFFIRLK